jgi:hypothetical protein
MGESRGACRILVWKAEGRRPLGRSGIGGRIILKYVFEKWDVGARTGLFWLRIWRGGGLL